jgi:DNA-binding beta-propeller fold protein YncE
LLAAGLSAAVLAACGAASTQPPRVSTTTSASVPVSPATAAHAVGPVVGCSTTVATAPRFDSVPTHFLTGPLTPFGVAVSANSKTAYVADSSGAVYLYALGSGAPTVDRVDSFRVKSVDGIPPQPGISPVGLALTPDNHYLIAAAQTGAVIFNTAYLSQGHSGLPSWVTGTFQSHGQGAIEAAVSPGGDYVFVTLEDSDELAVFDLKRALARGFRPSDLVGMVPLGVAPVGIAVSPDGHYLYVTSEAASSSQNEGTLTTINLARAETTPSRAVASTVSAGCSPVRVVATPTSVYVTARGSDAVLEFSAEGLIDDPAAAFRGDVRVGEAPVGLALVDRDRAIVVADSDRFAAPGAGANLAVVAVGGGGSMSLDGYMASGSFPRDMAVAPDGKTLVVSNFGSSQVESVDVSELPQP